MLVLARYDCKHPPVQFRGTGSEGKYVGLFEQLQQGFDFGG